MSEKSYIVHLIEGPDPKRAIKHFRTRADARLHATQSVSDQSAVRANIYEVPSADTGRAIAALRMGEGHLVESHGRPPTEREREQAATLLKNVISEPLW